MKGRLLMPSSTLDAHLHTIALAQAGHPRVLGEVMRGNTGRARLALTHRIGSFLEQQSDIDEAALAGPDVRAARALMNLPGPILRDRMEAVVEALLPE